MTTSERSADLQFEITAVPPEPRPPVLRRAASAVVRKLGDLRARDVIATVRDRRFLVLGAAAVGWIAGRRSASRRR